MVISSYQKSANLSRLRRKNLSRNEKSDDTANKNRICRRLADTRDLKSLSGDRVRVQAPQDLAAMGLTGTETILIHSSMKAIGVVEGGADTVLDVCIAGAEFCKPIRMQRYLCGSGCTAGVFFVQVLSEKGKSWYTVLKRI